ncbi:MAG TPA: response regulator [Chloroflexota bacterium]
MSTRGVLIVEADEPRRQQLMEAVGEELGAPVGLARDGLEAITRARMQRPAVVVLDLTLPGLDGLEVARRLRADPATADAWIIAIGASDDLGVIQSAGCDTLIGSPIEREPLLLAVAYALKHRLAATPPHPP